MSKKAIEISYVPSDTVYTHQQIEQFEQKLDELLDYIVKHLLFLEVPKE